MKIGSHLLSLFRVLTAGFLLVLSACGAGSTPSTPSSPVLVDASNAPRLALVIAVEQYATMDDLKNPVSDARLVSGALSSVGFDLPVSVRPNASRAEITEALSRFREAVDRAGENAVALIYFAGHGVQVFGVNYLLPSDARMPENIPARANEDLVVAALIQNNFLPINDFYLALDGRGDSAANILVLDACRDNPITRSISRTRGGASTRGLAEMEAQGFLIMYATGAGLPAEDGDAENSPFARAFASAITRPGNSETVNLDIRSQVSPETGGRQRPTIKNDLNVAFCFSGCTEQSASATQVTPTVAISCEQAERDWPAVAAETSLTVLTAFAESVPASCGLIRGRAQARLSAVNDAAELAFQRAAEAKAREGYEQFLSTYVGHTRVSEVQARLASCHSEVIDVQRRETSRVEDNDFDARVCRSHLAARCEGGEVNGPITYWTAYDRIGEIRMCGGTCVQRVTRRESVEVCN